MGDDHDEVLDGNEDPQGGDHDGHAVRRSRVDHVNPEIAEEGDHGVDGLEAQRVPGDEDPSTHSTARMDHVARLEREGKDPQVLVKDEARHPADRCFNAQHPRRRHGCRNGRTRALGRDRIGDADIGRDCTRQTCQTVAHTKTTDVAVSHKSQLSELMHTGHLCNQHVYFSPPLPFPCQCSLRKYRTEIASTSFWSRSPQ